MRISLKSSPLVAANVTLPGCHQALPPFRCQTNMTGKAKWLVQLLKLDLRRTLPAQHIRPSCIFCNWPNCLELITQRHAICGTSEVNDHMAVYKLDYYYLLLFFFCRQLHTVAKDVVIFVLFVCVKGLLRECAM